MVKQRPSLPDSSRRVHGQRSTRGLPALPYQKAKSAHAWRQLAVDFAAAAQRPLPQFSSPNQQMAEKADLVGQIIADIFAAKQIETRMTDGDGDIDAQGLGDTAEDMYSRAKTALLFWCHMGGEIDAIALPCELRRSVGERLRQEIQQVQRAQQAEKDQRAELARQAQPVQDQAASVPKTRPGPKPTGPLLPMPSTPLEDPPVLACSSVSNTTITINDNDNNNKSNNSPSTANSSSPSPSSGPAAPVKPPSGAAMWRNQTAMHEGQRKKPLPKPQQAGPDPNKGMSRLKSNGGLIQNSTRRQISKTVAPAAPAPAPTPAAGGGRGAGGGAGSGSGVVPATPKPKPELKTAAPEPVATPTPTPTSPSSSTATTATLDADGDSEMDDAPDPVPATIATTAAAVVVTSRVSTPPSPPPPPFLDLDNDVHMSNSPTAHPFVSLLGLDPRAGVNAALRMVRNCGEWCAWLRAELELALELILRQRQRV